VLVLVSSLQPSFVHMRMGVRLTVMGMLVLVLDVIVIVRRMCVNVRLAVMLMLVGVRGFVCVLVAHGAPFVD
jgi:hypothetical protein